MKKSTFGLDQNVASLLCYVAGWITGIIFFASEKEDKVVRFHGLQSIIWFGLLTAINIVVQILNMMLGSIPFIGVLFNVLFWFITIALGLLSFITWLLLIIYAAQGKLTKIPVIGQIVAKQVGLDD